MDAVKVLGSASPVVIFSKTNCCITHAVNVLIRDYGANPVVYELDKLPNGRQMEKALMELGCNPSTPAVFIGRKFRGGSNEIMTLNIKGELKQLLIDAYAIWV
ncbi:monothiol glutaredoxin-S6-like [Andrographis paniculata]|uniref:monothiol glutaredoxin-S6-like n=1 Tax=Andrographis paniculata TaxID=175694 RepID=UPI0021E92A2B|nr:monothiol glutaredoxin-S6-like [Andrographis paniculata]